MFNSIVPDDHLVHKVSWILEMNEMDVIVNHLISVSDFPLFQENYYWLDRILHSYQSRVYSGDVGTCFEVGCCNPTCLPPLQFCFSLNCSIPGEWLVVPV